MKLGYTVWTWLSDEHRDWRRVEDPKAGFEQALREISHLGYQTVENFNWFADFYEDNGRGYGLDEEVWSGICEYLSLSYAGL